MLRFRSEQLIVAVVDTQSHDYAVLLEAAQRHNARLELLALGRDALRMARTREVPFWVVNVALPDMSGLDLSAMLRTRSPQSVIYVVTDKYRAEEERAARMCGASFFGCKPVRAPWFDNWWEPSQPAGSPSAGWAEARRA